MAKLINIAVVFLFATLILIASGSLKHEVHHYEDFSTHHLLLNDVLLHTWFESEDYKPMNPFK